MDILTLLKANLKHRRSSFVSVLILMIIVSTIVTSALSIADNVTRRVNQANEAIGTGDIVVFINEAQFTDEMRSGLEKSDAVEKIKVIDSFLSSDTEVNNIQPDHIIFFTAYDCGDHAYQVFNDTSDAFVSNLAPLKDGEIYLPFAVKQMCSCEKGDQVSVKLSETTVYFTIAGFIEEPFMGCDVITTKNLLITENDLNRILEESTTAEVAPITEASPISPIKLVHIFGTSEYEDDVNDLSRAVNKDTGILDNAINSTTREHSRTYTLLLPLLMCGVLFLFLVILMTVVGLVLSNNIGTSIEMEYVNIGILKSQGFSKGKIRLVFLLQYLFPAVLGALMGLLLAYPAVNLIRPLFITISCVLVPNDLLLGRSITVLLGILLLIFLFIYIKTARVSKISPMRAISGGMEDVYFSSLIRTPVIGKSKSTIGIRLAFRQLTTNIKQYFGICIILTLLVFYLSTCNALLKNFSVNFYDEMYGITSADVCVDYNERIDLRENTEKDISALSTIDGSFAYGQAEFFVDDIPYTMQVIDDMSYLAHFIDGKTPEYDNELVISNCLSGRIHKNIGDHVTVGYGGDSREFIICGTYDSIFYAGNAFVLSFEAAQTLNTEIVPNQIYYLVSDPSRIDQINEAVDEKYNSFGIETTNPKHQSEVTINTAMTVMNSMILFIFIVAILFAVIVVWMVCTKSFLRERLNIGIYKAYGFSAFRLNMQFCFRYLIVALTACVFGVLLYTFFGDALNLTTFMILGITQFHVPLTPESYIIPPSLICLFVFLASYFTMRKINKVNTKELVVE